MAGPSGVPGITPNLVQTLVNPRGLVFAGGNVYFSDETSSTSGVVYEYVP